MALTQGKTEVVQAFVQTCSRTSAIAARALNNLSSSKVYKTLIFEKTIKIMINNVWILFAANALSCLCLQSSQCFFWKACTCKKQRKSVSVFSLASNCSDHWKKKAVQSGIQNKGNITNKFKDQIISYKCLVLMKIHMFFF